jgi:hypothetical protein
MSLSQKLTCLIPGVQSRSVTVKNDLHIRNLTPGSTILQASHRNMSIRAVLLF